MCNCKAKKKVKQPEKPKDKRETIAQIFNNE